MSSQDIAQARAFYLKAKELGAKGHLLRAAEIFGRAAEAARALDSAPDSLITAGMQNSQAHVLVGCFAVALNRGTADARVLAAYRADCVALLSTAVAALQRRCVAGTLLEGKCTAAEEAWDSADWTDALVSAAEAAGWAKLYGYDTFLRSAFSILEVFDNASLFASECSATQFEAFAQHAVRATDLMQLPRSRGTSPMAAEVQFADKLSSAMADESGVPRLQRRGLDAPLVQLLMAAWERLQRSGVLETRHVYNERARQIMSTRREKNAAAINAAMTAPGLRSCALAGCGAREAHPQHFKRCSACQAVIYCSKEHQLEAWPSHKAACKASRKAAAASADAGAGPGAAS